MLSFNPPEFCPLFSGMPALAAIEAIPTDSKDKPKDEMVLVKATVFSNPITEMEDALEQELQVKIDEREVSVAVRCAAVCFVVRLWLVAIVALLLFR